MQALDPKVDEVLTILAEECAEVIQEISKIRRFGIDQQHKDGVTHRRKLEQEVGDVLSMIDIALRSLIIDEQTVCESRVSKQKKLEIYSDIYKNYPELANDGWVSEENK